MISVMGVNGGGGGGGGEQRGHVLLHNFSRGDIISKCPP